MALPSYRDLKAYNLATFSIALGILLTFISLLSLCQEACTEAHNYQFLGTNFELIGIFYFLALMGAHMLSKTNPLFTLIAALMIAAGLGAETVFIWIQKTKIGHWCPICLSIAGTLLLTGFLYYFILQQHVSIKNETQGGFMTTAIKNWMLVITFGLGFVIAFTGVSKIDRLAAAEQAIQEKIKFGNTDSHLEVYVFTDWSCPACRTLEPKLKGIADKISDKASLTFVDFAIHPETLNYIPYNLAFMIQDKPKYFQAREALTKLSQKTKKPTDAQVTKAVSSSGITFHELAFEDISLGMKYFEHLADKYDVEATPTMILINSKAKTSKKLSGVEEINEANVLKALNSLKSK